ncbi:MAG: T9SS type A sorting domain-containing protein [Flavobacteriia bacterium]
MKKKLFLFFVFFCLKICLSQTIEVVQKHIPVNGFDYKRFGESVSMWGNKAVVGSTAAGLGSSGSVSVMEFDGSVWIERQELYSDQLYGMDEYAYDVDINENKIIVSAFYDINNNGDNVGSVYIYEYDGNSWSQQAKLYAPDGVNGDLFGISVAIEGDYAIIGAKHVSNLAYHDGAVYVYHFQNNLWNFEAKLTANDAALDNTFGTSLDLNQNSLVIGSRFSDENAYNTGSAYVFEKTGNTWTQTAKLIASDASEFALFGNEVAISGDKIIVGSYWNDNSLGEHAGAAYIFEYDGLNWQEKAKLTASDGLAEDRFGHAVALFENKAIVSASDLFTGKGASYIFEYNGVEWIETKKILPSDVEESDYFGESVSIYGDFAIVGSIYDNNSFIRNGSVYFLSTPYTAKIDQIRALDFKISPNPTNGSVKVDFAKSNSDISYKLSSPSGQMLILKDHFFGDNFEVDLSSFSNGMYYLEIDLEGKREVVKIIKE